jgi:hypothetical protein
MLYKIVSNVSVESSSFPSFSLGLSSLLSFINPVSSLAYSFINRDYVLGLELGSVTPSSEQPGKKDDVNTEPLTPSQFLNAFDTTFPSLDRPVELSHLQSLNKTCSELVTQDALLTAADANQVLAELNALSSLSQAIYDLTIRLHFEQPDNMDSQKEWVREINEADESLFKRQEICHKLLSAYSKKCIENSDQKTAQTIIDKVDAVCSLPNKTCTPRQIDTYAIKILLSQRDQLAKESNGRFLINAKIKFLLSDLFSKKSDSSFNEPMNSTVFKTEVKSLQTGLHPKFDGLVSHFVPAKTITKGINKSISVTNKHLFSGGQNISRFSVVEKFDGSFKVRATQMKTMVPKKESYFTPAALRSKHIHSSTNLHTQETWLVGSNDAPIKFYRGGQFHTEAKCIETILQLLEDGASSEITVNLLLSQLNDVKKIANHKNYLNDAVDRLKAMATFPVANPENGSYEERVQLLGDKVSKLHSIFTNTGVNFLSHRLPDRPGFFADSYGKGLIRPHLAQKKENIVTALDTLSNGIKETLKKTDFNDEDTTRLTRDITLFLQLKQSAVLYNEMWVNGDYNTTKPLGYDQFAFAGLETYVDILCEQITVYVGCMSAKDRTAAALSSTFSQMDYFTNSVDSYVESLHCLDQHKTIPMYYAQPSLLESDFQSILDAEPANKLSTFKTIIETKLNHDLNELKSGNFLNGSDKSVSVNGASPEFIYNPYARENAIGGISNRLGITGNVFSKQSAVAQSEALFRFQVYAKNTHRVARQSGHTAIQQKNAGGLSGAKINGVLNAFYGINSTYVRSEYAKDKSFAHFETIIGLSKFSRQDQLETKRVFEDVSFETALKHAKTLHLDQITGPKELIKA